MTPHGSQFGIPSDGEDDLVTIATNKCNVGTVNHQYTGCGLSTAIAIISCTRADNFQWTCYDNINHCCLKAMKMMIEETGQAPVLGDDSSA